MAVFTMSEWSLRRSTANWHGLPITVDTITLWNHHYYHGPVVV